MKSVPGNYSYKNLSLVQPSFDARLTTLIIDLDVLREKRLGGTTPASMFFQLKKLFHVLESLGSSRIEGNHTTLLDFIETKIDNRRSKDEKIREIQNIEKALAYIDEIISKNPNFQITEDFIDELQKMVVDGLSVGEHGEGDCTPGKYRKLPILIDGAEHIPPKPLELQYYMDELIDFINKKDEPKYDLLKIALAHHRFVWIHPFGNGNGRTVRLLTYAQLVLSGFRVDVGGRIINPTAVFCNDRSMYYNGLSAADSGSISGLLSWCEYVLGGLKTEIEKVDKLTDYDYLARKILLPAISYCLDKKIISNLESEVLKIAVKKVVFDSTDIAHLFPNKVSSHISRFISKMKHKKLITAEVKNGRKYLINFEDSELVRGVITSLGENGFLTIEDLT